MKYLLSSLFVLFLSSSVFSQAIISQLTLNNLNPNNCSNTTASVNLTLYCANYTFNGATVTVSGSTVSIDINYSVGLICLPAFQYPTVNVNLGQLPAGPISITAYSYLNNVLSSTSSTINTNVSACCGAIASFVPSDDTICQGDVITLTNNSTNADSISWYINSSFADTAFSPSFGFDSAGIQEIMLVAYADTCNDTATHDILVYPSASIDFGNDTSICDGEELVLTLPSNVSNILWSDGSTASTNSFGSVGTYWASGESNQGCAGSDTISIISILPFADVDLGEDFDLCPGTPQSISPGANFDDYLWSNGDTTSSILVAFVGVYWVEASAAGLCPSRDTVIVGQHSIDPLAFLDEESKCGSNTVTTTTNYSDYQWSSGGTGISETFTDSTTVYLTVTDFNDCQQSDSFDVVVWPLPPVDLGNDTTYCPGQQLILTSNVTGSYLWNTGNTNSALSVLSAGQYWLEVTDGLGCVGRDTIQIGVCVGSNEIAMEGVSLYPNPVVDELHIDFERSTNRTIRIYDLHGKIVLSENVANRSIQLNVASLPSGTFAVFIDEDNTTLPPLQIIKR